MSSLLFFFFFCECILQSNSLQSKSISLFQSDGNIEHQLIEALSGLITAARHGGEGAKPKAPAPVQSVFTVMKFGSGLKDGGP